MAKVLVSIQSATEPDPKGLQEVNFDLSLGGKVIVNHTMTSDVENIKTDITNFAQEYKVKYTSVNKLKSGDSFEIEV